MGTEIEFTGHIISEKGIKPDKKKFAAIKEFPVPKMIRDIKAFLGFTNQLASFVPQPSSHDESYRTTLEERGSLDMVRPRYIYKTR